jgi:uncharacterized repeat protein (TIGR01451 family)
MVFSKVLSWSKQTGQSSTRGRPGSVRSLKLLPRLEALEDRLVPAVFNVTSLLDSNVAGSGSLRRAITDSNATAGPNQINILTPGTCRLTLNGADDSNSAGDLDLLTNDVAIINQSGGTVAIEAGSLMTPDRVIDVSPTGGRITATIKGVTIEGGLLTGTDRGAGVRVQAGSSLTLNNDLVQNNTTADFGGGIYAMNSDVKLDATTLFNNNASDGAGIVGVGSSTLTITNSLIVKNTATGPGGGVDSRCKLTMSSSTVMNNEALEGGGVFLLTKVDCSLTNVTISCNKAKDGGGLLNDDSDSIITLVNDTIVFNSATVFDGGGLHSLSIRGATRVSNTIVARNTAARGGPDVDNSLNPADLVDVTSNFIGNNTGAEGSFAAGAPNAHGSFVGTTTALLDPLLEPLADNGGTVVLPDGSHLPTHKDQANSGNNGVRDRGFNFTPLNGPTTDERGLPRPSTGPVDIGAVQFQNIDLAVHMSAPAGTVHAGLPATFTVTVRNLGPSPSHGVTLTDTLPAGTTVVAASAGFTVRGNVVTFVLPDLAAGASTTLTLTVIPAAPGPFTATASANALDDSNLANNTASASVVVLPRPISATGTGDGTATGVADVTGFVRVERLSRRGPRKRLLYRITNVSGTPIQGPVALEVTGPPLRPSARLHNAGGHRASRDQLVRLDVGGDNILDPGESALVQLVFAKPFNPRRLSVLAGAFA